MTLEEIERTPGQISRMTMALNMVKLAPKSFEEQLSDERSIFADAAIKFRERPWVVPALHEGAIATMVKGAMMCLAPKQTSDFITESVKRRVETDPRGEGMDAETRAATVQRFEDSLAIEVAKLSLEEFEVMRDAASLAHAQYKAIAERLDDAANKVQRGQTNLEQAREARARFDKPRRRGLDTGSEVKSKEERADGVEMMDKEIAAEERQVARDQASLAKLQSEADATASRYKHLAQMADQVERLLPRAARTPAIAA